MIKYSSPDAVFITKRFPELSEKVEKNMCDYDGFLPNVVFGKVFNRLTVSLLKQDTYLINNTLLENLRNEKTTYDRAAEMIGDNTKAVRYNITSYNTAPKNRNTL